MVTGWMDKALRCLFQLSHFFGQEPQNLIQLDISIKCLYGTCGCCPGRSITACCSFESAVHDVFLDYIECCKRDHCLYHRSDVHRVTVPAAQERFQVHRRLWSEQPGHKHHVRPGSSR